MSRFKRVEETQNIPQYIEERFAGAAEDPYKELRQGQQDRQRKIASQNMGARQVKAQEPREWERLEPQAEYERPTMMREFDQELSRFSAADVSSNSIRRLDTGYDAGINTRSAGNDLYVTQSDALDLIRRGVSMWNNDMEAISAVCQSSIDEHDSQFASVEKRRMARNEKHKKWERKASRRELLGRGVVLDRAGAVVRSSHGNEFVAESSFGLPNYDNVIEREKERMQSIKAARDARMELKRQGYSPEERHQSWEESAARAVHAQRYSDQKFDWVDQYVRKYEDDFANDIDLSRD